MSGEGENGRKCYKHKQRQVRSYFISSAQNINLTPGLCPEPNLQCVVGNRVLTKEVPSSHSHLLHALLEERQIKNTSCSERNKSIFIRAAPLTPPRQINTLLHNGVTKAATKSPGNAKQPHKEYRKVIEYPNWNFNYLPSRAH